MANDETFTITLSSKQGRVALLAVALLVGGGSVSNIFIDKRPDPFTGAMGQALDDRITALEFFVEDYRERLILCKQRMDKHLEFSEHKVNQLDVTLERHKIKLDECLKRTGVK